MSQIRISTNISTMQLKLFLLSLLFVSPLAAQTLPPGKFQIVYNGRYEPNGAKYVILDLFEHSSQDTAKAKASGALPIAYFSAHYEDWRPDKHKLASARTKKLGSWKGEFYVNWREPAVQACMLTRMDLAKRKGFLGVDIDNIDGPGMTEYFPWLLAMSKEKGLYCGLKNAVELLPKYGKQVDFFVIEATDAQELKMYQPFKQPKFRMVYNRVPSPPGMAGARNGVDGNRF